MSFRLNSRWISYGDFCHDGCVCEEIRFEEFPYLLLHVGETDLPDYDEERISNRQIKDIASESK